MAIPQDQSAFDDAFEAMVEDGTLRATEVTDRLERVLDASRLWQCGQLTDDDFREAMRAEGHEARLEVTGVDQEKEQGSHGLGDQWGSGGLSLEGLTDDVQPGEADD
jgi:hypothetical protein